MFRRYSSTNFETKNNMSETTTKTKITLKSFYIYNSTLCPREGQEEKKILFYHPAENDQNQKIKDVGFSEAIVKASSDFLGDSEKYVEHLRTQKTLQLYFQPENEFWMVMIVNVPYEKKINKDNTEQIEYFGEDVHEKIFTELLRLSYRMFRLFHNSFTSNIAKSTEALINILEKFYSKYLLTVNLNNGDILDCLNCCIQYFPITHFNFLRIINFINMLETHFTAISNCIFLYNEQIIYSAINPIDLFSISEYLNTNLFPKMKQRDSHGDFNSVNGSFLTGPSCLDPCSDVPEMFLVNQQTKQLEKFNVIIFKVSNSTLCMMVKDYDPKNLELFNEIKSYIGPQLTSISKDIEESMKTVQQLSNTITDKQNAADTSNQQKYLYFNDLNRRFYATFYEDLSKNNSRLVKSHTIPSDVMNLIVDMYARDFVEKSNVARIEDDKETIIKSEKHADYWIIKRSSNSRHLYLIMHKTSTLIDVADESRKLMDNIIKNVYFNKH